MSQGIRNRYDNVIRPAHISSSSTWYYVTKYVSAYIQSIDIANNIRFHVYNYLWYPSIPVKSL